MQIVTTKRKRIPNSHGIAMLEAVGILVLILPILLGAIGLLTLISNTMAVNGVVDKYLYDKGVRPLRIESNNGMITIVTNSAEISAFADELVEKMRVELSERLKDDFIAPGGVLIEVIAVQVPINPASGTVNGSHQILHTTSYGSLSPDSATQSASSLTKEIERLVSAKIVHPDGTEMAQLAVPSGRLGHAGAAQFLDRSILVAARAVISMNDSFAGGLYADLGGNPVAFDSKAVMLRGEFQ